MSTNSTRITRRRLIQTTAAASTLFAVPTIVRAGTIGRGGVVAPRERIILGGIGIRNRGSKVLGAMLAQPDVRFVAIADVRADRRQAVKEMADQANGDGCAGVSFGLRGE